MRFPVVTITLVDVLPVAIVVAVQSIHLQGRLCLSGPSLQLLWTLAYTFGGVRDLLQSHHWQLGLGADVTFYSKPAVLDTAYGGGPVSFHVFLRVRPGVKGHRH